MNGLENVLVVGGGIGGMATSIRLRQEGVAVDLIDLDPAWKVYGAGITITGPTLRAYKRLGLIDKIRAAGAVLNGQRIYRYDGTLLHQLDEPPLEDGLPATGGILRPVLHGIMSAEVRERGVHIRLGLTVRALAQDPSGVRATFSDGSTGRYDLVVGADGINSSVRSLLFGDRAVLPRYTGQGSWRILAERPPGMDKGEIYLGHRNLVGLTACSADLVYVFMLNPDPDRRWIEPDDQPAMVRDLLADFGGNIGPIRAKVGPRSSIVYRPLETALQPRPWNLGRVILIGDAAHATTPHLASGAGIAVEDALVLVEELGRHGSEIEAALAAFTDRRFERCRMVVDSSVALGALQLREAPEWEIGAAMSKALHALMADI